MFEKPRHGEKSQLSVKHITSLYVGSGHLEVCVCVCSSFGINLSPRPLFLLPSSSYMMKKLCGKFLKFVSRCSFFVSILACRVH